MESPPYRGVKRAVTSWGPLVIAPPLAGSLLAPLRCAAPCQFRCRATWPPQDSQALRKLLSHLPLSRAVYLRPAELHALRDGALETCFYSLADHRPLKLSKGAHPSFTGESAKTPATIRPVPTKSTRSFTTA